MIAQVAQGRVQEGHRAGVAPVQVVEHQEHRLPVAFRLEPVLERPPHHIAHQLGIGPGRPQRLVLPVGEGDPAELPEQRQPLAGLGPAFGRVTLTELAPGLLRPLAVADAGVAAQGPGQERKRRSGRERIGHGEQHLQLGGLALGAGEELLQQAGLADAGGTDHQGGLGRALVETGGEQALQAGQLAAAPHELGRLAQQPVPGLGQGRVALEVDAPRLARDLEPDIRQGRHHVVQADASHRGVGQQPHRRLNQAAQPGRAVARADLPRGDGDGPVGGVPPRRQRRPRRMGGELARFSHGRHADHERPVGKAVQRRPVGGGQLRLQRPQIVRGRRVLDDDTVPLVLPLVRWGAAPRAGWP